MLCLLNPTEHVTVTCCNIDTVQQHASKRQRVEPAPSLETSVVAKKKPVAAASRTLQSRTTRQKTAAAAAATAVTTARPAATARAPTATVAAPKPPPAKGELYVRVIIYICDSKNQWYVNEAIGHLPPMLFIL